MEELTLFLLVGVALLVSLSSLDDMFIDMMALAISRTTSDFRTDNISLIPEIAVFIANWHEEDVLEKMVEGNLARIPYPSVTLFLGTYPNDTGTLTVAQRLEQRNPNRVRVVVNPLPGPTSKGQMLNEMFHQVFAPGAKNYPEIVVLHDSEDVIDQRTFPIYAAYTNAGFDFIQIPVFSFDRGKNAYVAATYMDEFAERHTREMIVRNAVGAMIPSAGVGTGLTRRLITHFLATRAQVLMSGTVTEDYILGIEAKRSGFKAAFAAISADDNRGLDFVATREFFPRTLQASIKQKTRWVYGINFEAMRKLGWKGDFWDKYFFIRDRKGIITNFLPPISMAMLITLLFGYPDLTTISDVTYQLITMTMWFNLIALGVRYIVRVHACYKVYGTTDFIGIALRWPVSLYINMTASFRAWKTYLGESQFATKPIVWSKTAHELPDDFIGAKR